MKLLRSGFQLFILFIISGITQQIWAQGNGTIYGQVTDGQTKNPLGYVSVSIPALNLGTNTNLEGNYRLLQVKAGTYTIVFSYLGYPKLEREIDITTDQELILNIELAGDGVTLDEVVIQVQGTGQRAAINQQINSNTIVNVVSQERLRELPDQNAAEAVGRLAGVSVYRDAGEGQQVSVRGISPRFNSITINGERLPSTELETRSVDLSMISSDALAGIELYKASRPDMDGDAIGGTVNFTVKKADKDFFASVRSLGTYNNLKSDFGNFRGVATISNRFLEEKLGILASANYQLVNRSNEFLTTNYEFLGNNPNTGEPIIGVATLNLGDRLEDRKRYGGSLTMDYNFNSKHNIVFSGNGSRLDRNDQDYRRRYGVANNEQRFTARQRERSTLLLSGTLSGEHIFKSLTLNWRGSVSSSDQQTPHALRGQFWELAAMSTAVENDRDLTSVPLAFKNNLNNTFLRDMRFQSGEVKENRKTFQMDLKYDLTLTKWLNGYLKAGGKYRGVSRGKDLTEDFMRPYLDGEENPARFNPDLLLTVPDNKILLINFMGDYLNDEFYGGEFDIHPGTPDSRANTQVPLKDVDIAAFNELFGTDYSQDQLLDFMGHIDHDKLRRFYEQFSGRASRNNAVDLQDYDGKEDISAAYAMAEFNIGQWLMLMGGLRFEGTRQEYTSRTGSPRDEDEGGSGYLELIDVTASQGYQDLLPMGHIRIKPVKWFDVRGAITKTLARPNFFNLVPWEEINNSEQIISRGKPDLKHTTAWNYDIFLSFYNKFGLFTLGGFYKELDNIDYIKTTSILDGGIFNGYTLNEPDNVIGTSIVKGLEFDLQANLNALKGFFRGFIIGANLTLARSQTFYPVFNVETNFIPTPPFFITTVTDTVRSGPVVGQANIITNLSLGYEFKGFSGRVSAFHQSKTLSPGNPGVGRSGSGVQRIPELDFYDDKFWRFDLALKQRLDKKGRWTLLFNMNNISNTPERALQGTENLLQEEEFFGYTAELGLLYKFRKE